MQGKRYRLGQWPVFALFLLLDCLCNPAWANDQDTVNAVLSVSRQYNDNLFLLPAEVSPQAVLGTSTKSDWITATDVGLHIDKHFSLQELKLNVDHVDNSYRNFGYLNFQATNYMAAWNWALTPRLTGSVSADRTQSLAGFADYTNYSGRNISTVENRAFHLDGMLFGGWHLVGAVSQQNQFYSQFFSVSSASTYRSREAGIRYIFSSGSSLAFIGREGDGGYPGRILNVASQSDTGFTQTEHELNFNWLPSAKSSLNVVVNRLSREHLNFSSRNYAGTVGRVDYTWLATGKLQLACYYIRDLGPYWQTISSFVKSDTIGFAPTWAISSKLALIGRTQESRRDTSGSLVPIPYDREDKVKTSSLSLNWAPTNSLVLVAGVQSDRRSSNYFGFDYASHSANFQAQMTF